MIISCSFLLSMRNISIEICSEYQNTQLMFENIFFSKILPFMRMWKNHLEPDRQQMTIWPMCIECWIPKATNTYSDYVILTACPLQQWSNERASVLRYTRIVCRVRSSRNLCYSVCNTHHIPRNKVLKMLREFRSSTVCSQRSSLVHLITEELGSPLHVSVLRNIIQNGHREPQTYF